MDASHKEVGPDSGPGDLKQIYQTNLGYDVDSDVTQCQRFIKACRAILALPVDTTNAVEGVRFNRELIDGQLTKALSWLNRRNNRRPRAFVVHPEWSR